jgi:mycofactocin glycosyltransferase
MEALLRRLVDSAIVHPVPVGTPTRLAEVSVVIPVLDDPTRLDRLLGALVPDRRSNGLDAGNRDGSVSKIIVVDDGSAPAAADLIARAAKDAGATLVRHHQARGPGSARNSGLARVATPLVAFVDVDVLPDTTVDQVANHWLAALTGHFEDPRVAAVSPRVVAMEPREGVAPVLLAYERRHSPLDLGPTPAVVGPGHRVRYVPAATIVARTSVVREVGGFDPGLRYGEDVDLVWRIVQAGWTVRYAPSENVGHDVRPTLAGVARQRFVYGRSAAALDRRHPGAVPAYECSPRAVLLLAATVAGLLRPLPHRARKAAGLLAVLTFVVPSVRLARKLRRSRVAHSGTLAAELIIRANMTEVSRFRQTMGRTWWPLSVILLVTLRRDRRAIAQWLGFLIVPTAIEAVRQSPSPVCTVAEWLGVALLDDMSYGAGVWAGAARERRFRPLLPEITRRSASR